MLGLGLVDQLGELKPPAGDDIGVALGDGVFKAPEERLDLGAVLQIRVALLERATVPLLLLQEIGHVFLSPFDRTAAYRTIAMRLRSVTP